jgi:hypothetical protein
MTNDKTSDARMARSLFKKLFSLSEITEGNLSGDWLRGQNKNEPKPKKWDTAKMEFIFQTCRGRLVVLAQYMKVSVERLERTIFNHYIRDAKNAIKKQNKKEQRD